MKRIFSVWILAVLWVAAPFSEARSELNIDVQLGNPYYYYYTPPPPVVHYYREEPAIVYRRPHHRPHAHYYGTYDHRGGPCRDSHHRHKHHRYHD